MSVPILWLGLAALLVYLLHGAWYLRRRRLDNMLWACNVGLLLVVTGNLFASAHVNAIGAMLLAVGLPLWLLDLALGGEFLVTSPFSHVGGLFVGMSGMAELGFPGQIWWKTWLVLVGLHLLCRFVTSPRENVNLAHDGWANWRRYFSSLGLFHVTLTLAFGVAFFTLEVGLRLVVERISLAGI